MDRDKVIVGIAREWKRSPEKACDAISGIISRIEITLKTLFGSQVIGFVNTGIPESAIPERARKRWLELSKPNRPAMTVDEFRSYWLQNVFPSGEASDGSLIADLSRVRLALETIQPDGGFPFRTDVLLQAEDVLMAVGSDVSLYGGEIPVQQAGAFNSLFFALISEGQKLQRWIDLRSVSDGETPAERQSGAGKDVQGFTKKDLCALTGYTGSMVNRRLKALNITTATGGRPRKDAKPPFSRDNLQALLNDVINDPGALPFQKETSQKSWNKYFHKP